MTVTGWKLEVGGSIMLGKYSVVDLFAGPGGLAEGFWGFQTSSGGRPYKLSMSVEMERSAHKTLRLRNFLRQFPDGFPDEYYRFLNAGTEGILPDWAELYPREWQQANNETLFLELGQVETARILGPKITQLRKEKRGETILIGGPPCQAYSLVGRAKNSGKDGYVASEDHRHYLYKEYLNILKCLKPAAFVMENVKGILSSSVKGSRIFQQVLDDLKAVGRGKDAYQLVALKQQGNGFEIIECAEPADFVVRAEKMGIPQARHRVIVIGIRKDKWKNWQGAARSRVAHYGMEKASVRHVLSEMPVLRSGLSKGGDSFERWKGVVLEALDGLGKAGLRGENDYKNKFGKRVEQLKKHYNGVGIPLSRKQTKSTGLPNNCPAELRTWLLDERLNGLPNNETRGHMASDLQRYLFAAIHGELTGVTPKALNFPSELAPAHKNWNTGKFADRFRVQMWDRPSTTITCHISKDGHYFIHPDPGQCRSLTVREAARLQTFPDNYFFMGNRTQQYVQVGNAVPPLLARQIAETLHEILEGKGAASDCDVIKGIGGKAKASRKRVARV